MELVKRWGFATNRGLVRSINEDNLIAAPPVFVVADGMGGHAAGDVASALAVREFKDLAGATEVNAADALEAIAKANAAILGAAAEDSSMEGMGTTIAGLVEVTAAGTTHWMIFNVGDCRVYRSSSSELRQLTIDHSEVQELIDAGQLTRHDARSHRRRNVVTRSLGTESNPAADSWVFPPLGHERFIICSDGLTGEVEDGDIKALSDQWDDPQAAADGLIQLALDGGGRDNVTVIVVDGQAPATTLEVDEDTAPRPRGSIK